ncbi:hypothetical protein Ciccas_009571 [Cichlidogyrus casuarinus]|uniref:Uncharacterized protein n=1 Tax=Cichlidogyrus casuarinus TaxID=1844966 RepID=A0ABD2PWM8_9PLAT
MRRLITFLVLIAWLTVGLVSAGELKRQLATKHKKSAPEETVEATPEPRGTRQPSNDAVSNGIASLTSALRATVSNCNSRRSSRMTDLGSDGYVGGLWSPAPTSQPPSQSTTNLSAFIPPAADYSKLYTMHLPGKY